LSLRAGPPEVWHQDAGQPVGQIAGSFFGVTPVGYKAEHTAEQQLQAESGRIVELTPLQKKLRQ
jgi:hypothetical protein